MYSGVPMRMVSMLLLAAQAFAKPKSHSFRRGGLRWSRMVLSSFRSLQQQQKQKQQQQDGRHTNNVAMTRSARVTIPTSAGCSIPDRSTIRRHAPPAPVRAATTRTPVRHMTDVEGPYVLCNSSNCRRLQSTAHHHTAGHTSVPAPSNRMCAINISLRTGVPRGCCGRTAPPRSAA
jgi:hypothetical protein